MKKLSICLIFVLCAGLMAACNTNQKKKEKYNRKIYLTEEPVAAPTTKKCPFCCSEIPLEATRCPHCTSEIK